MSDGDSVRQYDEPLGAALDETAEGVLDLVGPRQLLALGSHPQRLSCSFYLCPTGAVGWGLRNRDNGHPGDLGHGFTEQLHPFPGQPFREVENPVMFPPGRARLATKPLPTGSPMTATTIGMVRVACCRAATAALLCVTITSTLRWTSSLARAGSRSGLPSAQR
jgi:hypothetical protein